MPLHQCWLRKRYFLFVAFLVGVVMVGMTMIFISEHTHLGHFPAVRLSWKKPDVNRRQNFGKNTPFLIMEKIGTRQTCKLEFNL